ncbi:hypothetical protein ACO1O0_004169 [Amphichorda felina]
MPNPGAVIPFTPGQHTHLIPYLAAIHASCITHDRTIATFLPPLSHEKLLAWWKDRIAEVADGSRLIYVLLRDDGSDDEEAAHHHVAVSPKGPEVVGVVMLAMPFSETGAFRAAVEKLLVHASWRRRGGATRLIDILEREALHRGKTLLTLDTETGSPAESLFLKLGYAELGRIPRYGLSPAGELKDETFFYKQLDNT